jgi:hypothetical protein
MKINNAPDSGKTNLNKLVPSISSLGASSGQALSPFD